ncbi:hypothetical protein CEXT_458651 [Caerostris extrusa]|uniref:Uncharacterized protein n=1 Tax=Caerostris extrusa TaxID=172846 RepID=A0AAV4MUE0_CAEEX|nr:hypothetical protein CEXT_458651 [Caerostris extrusa]
MNKISIIRKESQNVNSLCNLINTRLKLLENEIFAQHKVWEYIQREVDEVKSLIEDCTSTCDSSLSGLENESEIVDSALESHKTCNSLLWDKIKQAEVNVEEKKSLMQIISSDVLKLKGSKKKCKRKLEKTSSNIDLILEVTNGLHALKCDEFFEPESSSFCTESIYSSFEEFCQHFQNLQEELMQLKHILLAAEENHLDELSCDDPDNADPVSIFETNQIFGVASNNADKQLANLRNRIFEVVRIIRDVEVEENDDENLINMVASLSEECSALRQEVSYLRNVRQEKKRGWNKLQCFIMDAERKLKGSNRNISGLREVIKDLGHIISTSDSSSLDETILYMYTNQLEWIEKIFMGCESPADQPVLCDDNALENQNNTSSLQNTKCRYTTVSTQTLIESQNQKENEMDFIFKRSLCDIASQTDDVSNVLHSQSSSNFESVFQEISREIYVVPEVLEESDSCTSTPHEINTEKNTMNDINLMHDSNEYIEEEIDCSSNCQELFDDFNCDKLSETSLSSSIISLSGNFSEAFHSSSNDKFGRLVFPFLNVKSNSPLLRKSNISLIFPDPLPTNQSCDILKYFSDSNSFMNLFFNTNIGNLYSSIFRNMLKDNVKSIEICDEDRNLSCVLLKSRKIFFPTFLLRIL